MQIKYDGLLAFNIADEECSGKIQKGLHCFHLATGLPASLLSVADYLKPSGGVDLFSKVNIINEPFYQRTTLCIDLFPKIFITT